MWAKLGLDNAPNVLAWIDLYEPGGYGACGFQVFIKGRDFEEPPRARAVPDKAQDPLKPLRTAAIKAGVEQGLDPARVSVAAYELCYDGDVFVPGVTVEAVLARAAGGG